MTFDRRERHSTKTIYLMSAVSAKKRAKKIEKAGIICENFRNVKFSFDSSCQKCGRKGEIMKYIWQVRTLCWWSLAAIFGFYFTIHLRRRIIKDKTLVRDSVTISRYFSSFVYFTLLIFLYYLSWVTTANNNSQRSMPNWLSWFDQTKETFPEKLGNAIKKTKYQQMLFLIPSQEINFPLFRSLSYRSLSLSCKLFLFRYIFYVPCFLWTL